MWSLAIPTSVRRRRQGDGPAHQEPRDGAGATARAPDHRPGRRTPTRAILTLLILAAVCRGLVWVAAMPPWQGPDEPSHYAYAVEVAHGEVRPAVRVGFAPSEAVAASVWRSAWEGYQFRNHDRPLTPEQQAALLPEQPGLSDRSPSVIDYPPVAYLVLAPAARLPGLDTATERLYAMRILLVLVGALLVPLTYLLVRDVVRDERLALAGAALVSTAPLVSHASAVVNADIVLTVLTTGVALVAVRIGLHGPSVRRLAGLAVLAAAAALTKPIGPPAVAVVAGTLVVVPVALRRWGHPWRVAGAWIAVLVVVLAALTQARTTVGGLDGLRFAASYLWQFYLPPVEGLTEVPRPEVLSRPVPAWPIWGKMGIGWFGWISVQMPLWAYVLGAGSVLAAVVVGVWGAVRRPAALDAVRRRLTGAAVLTVACFVLVLHAAEIGYMPGAQEPLLQGRYLLPVVPLLAVPLMAGLASLGRRRGLWAAGGLVAVWTLISVAAVNSVLFFYGA